MGRPRKHGKHLPRHVYQKNGGYYLGMPSGKQKWFGRDLARVMAEWSKTYADDNCQTLDQVMDQYVIQELPDRAPRTQSDYRKYIERLRPVFGHCRPDDLLPKDFHKWHKLRSKQSPTQANRELSLLKTIYNFAICNGWSSETPSPVSFVSGNKEKPRTRYVSDAELHLVYQLAGPAVRVAMELSALTGIRQGDLLRLKRSDFRDDGLHWTQGKTGKKMHVEWTDALNTVYQQGLAVGKTSSIWFLPSRSGGPYTSDGFRSLWHRVMDKAVEQGMERFTFHDLRAKAGTDAKDWQLLGHTDRKTHARVYDRKVTPVKPVR